MHVNVSKVKSSYNTFKAVFFDAFLNASFSVIFDNNVLGVIALNHFVKMVKKRFCYEKIEIRVDREYVDIVNPALLSDFYDDLG